MRWSSKQLEQYLKMWMEHDLLGAGAAISHHTLHFANTRLE